MHTYQNSTRGECYPSVTSGATALRCVLGRALEMG
eukprot:SAG25_NODE_3976_length_915_cov_0.881127_1_plen_34_part_10